MTANDRDVQTLADVTALRRYIRHREWVAYAILFVPLLGLSFTRPDWGDTASITLMTAAGIAVGWWDAHTYRFKRALAKLRRATKGGEVR